MSSSALEKQVTSGGDDFSLLIRFVKKSRITRSLPYLSEHQLENKAPFSLIIREHLIWLVEGQSASLMFHKKFNSKYTQLVD